MKYFYLALFILATTLNSNAQNTNPRKVKGNGRVMERARKVTEFNKLEITGNITVILLNNDFKKEIFKLLFLAVR